MKTITTAIAVCLLFSLFICSDTYSQAYTNSKFLYGKARQSNPFTVGLDVGVITRRTLFMNDFKNERFDIGYGLSLNKPISSRFALEGVVRTGADLYGKEGNRVTPEGSSTIVNYYVIERPVDFFGSVVYNIYADEFFQINASAGVGLIYFKTRYYTPGNTYNKRPTYELIVPLTVSAKRKLSETIDIGLGYRYYIGFVDNMDGFYANNNNDKYSYIYAGLYFNIGEKDYRFKRTKDCPSVY